MVDLKSVYESEIEIPDEYRDLYEADGEGFRIKRADDKTEELKRLKKSAFDERVLREELENKVKSKIGNMSIDEALAKMNPSAGEDFSLTRSKSETEDLRAQLMASEERCEKMKVAEIKGKIRDEIRKVAVVSNVVSSAIDDTVELASNSFQMTSDGSILNSSGASVSDWFSDSKVTRPHIFGRSTGGGALGNPTGAVVHGPNPWMVEHRNLTKQSQIWKRDPDLARSMAAEAGAKIDA